MSTAVSIPEPDSVSLELLREVASRSEESVEELPPLYQKIDPDVLEALFGSTGREGPVPVILHFPYHGFEVTISYDGEVIFELERSPRR